MKRLHIAALAAGFMIFAPSHAGAFVLSEPTDTLPELDVTVRKSDKALYSSVPLHTIDREKILLTGVSDISDALRRLPGVNLRDYGGAGGLKTVAVRGLGAQHTGVSYDGVALSDARSGEIDLSRFSLENIGELSLTAGSPDDIFITARAAASASVLSLSSFRPGRMQKRGADLTAQLRAGAFGMINPYLSGGWSNGRDFMTSVTLEFLHARNDYPFTLHNGELVTRERRHNSMMNSTHAEINAEWRPDEVTSVGGKVYCYDNLRRLPGPVIYYLSESHERLHDRNVFAQARWRRKMNSHISLQASGKFNWSGTRYTDIGEQYPGGGLDQNYLQREYYLSGALLWLPMEGLSASYAADWVYQNLDSNLPTDTRPYRNTLLQSLSARYSIGWLTATARLLHTLTLDRSRETATDKSDASRLSPSVSVSFQPWKEKGLRIRASYRNIFRSPTFNELYFDHYGTLNLLPEVAEQWNVGATWNPRTDGVLKNLSVIADGYVNLVSNKIVAIPFSLFRWTMTNLGKVRIFGADITLDAEIALAGRQSLLLTGNYSYQRAQPRTSPEMLDWMKQLAYTPLNSGNVSLTWLNPWVSAAVSVTATSARYTTSSNLPGTRIPGYADTGLTLFRTFQLRGHSLEVRADVTNLLNKQYQIVARYPMPGRAWTLSFKFKL